MGVASQSLASKPDQVKDYFVKAFARPICIRFKNQEARVVSDSVVIEAGEADLTRPPETGGGAPAVISARYDMVLIRDRTGWKIAALHASRKPQ